MREFDTLRQALTGPAIIALCDAPWSPIYILVGFLIHPWIGLLVLAGAENVCALGMRQAMVRRHLAERDSMMTLQTGASFAASRYITLSKFIRLALQSLALGLGAWLAIGNSVSVGAIFAATFLAGRALQPIEQLLST